MSLNKVAVVTGANKGLGFAIVEGLCRKFNGTVYLTSRDERRGYAAMEGLEKLGHKVKFHQLDITDSTSIQRFCKFVEKEHGKIDIVINNAGILFPIDAKEPKVYQAEQTMLVNFFSLVTFTEAVIPLIKDGGTIVNISSSSGHLSRIPSIDLRNKISSPHLILDGLNKLMKSYIQAVRADKETEEGWGYSPYVVSKVGVNAYTFILCRRLKSNGIRVNCVHPGYVISDMTKGTGSIEPKQASEVVLKQALEPSHSGMYIWHNEQTVPWDGEDPRIYIDGKI